MARYLLNIMQISSTVACHSGFHNKASTSKDTKLIDIAVLKIKFSLVLLLMTLILCMFSQYLPSFTTAKLPEHFRGPVAQSTSVGTRERMGTNKQLGEERVERDCNSPSLYWFILSVNRPKKQTSRNKSDRLTL